MKPLLLLDIDGVLAPYGAKDKSHLRPVPLHEFAMFDPRHIDDLRDLGEVFEIVWATMWCDDANKVMSPALKLPELPFVPFHITRFTNWIKEAPEGVTFKLPYVKDFVGDRPAAWIDDDLWGDAASWANKRNESVATKLFPTNPWNGMTPDIVADMIRWGESIERITE